MSAEIEQEAESHSRGAGWTWMMWLGGALLVYVLSGGPAALLEDKGCFKNKTADMVLNALYLPWKWAYQDTPLHRPLGMYLHLWVPKEIDKNGDEK